MIFMKVINSRLFATIVLFCFSSFVSSCILLLDAKWTPLSVTERTHKADIVIIGKIIRKYNLPENTEIQNDIDINIDSQLQNPNTYSANILVLSILKGQTLLEESLPILPGQNVNVTNFGLSSACYSDVVINENYVLFLTLFHKRLSAKYDDIFGAATLYSPELKEEVLQGLG